MRRKLAEPVEVRNERQRQRYISRASTIGATQEERVVQGEPEPDGYVGVGSILRSVPLADRQAVGPVQD